MTIFLGFCKVDLCTSEARSWGYCGRHAWRHFEPGEECSWCGALLTDPEFPESRRCRNRRDEAFCSPSHRSASGRALRQLLASEEVRA